MDETYVEAIPHGNGEHIEPAVYIMWPSGEVTIVVQSYKGATVTFPPVQAIFYSSFFTRAIESKTKKRSTPP